MVNFNYTQYNIKQQKKDNRRTQHVKKTTTMRFNEQIKNCFLPNGTTCIVVKLIFVCLFITKKRRCSIEYKELKLLQTNLLIKQFHN